MKAVVLCAGFGTRLGEHVLETPKPLLPVGGRPLLHWTLDWLAVQGIEQVAINLHYRADDIRASVGDGRAFGVAVLYHPEPTLLGTAGTVRALREWIAGEDVCVVYGDLLIDEDLSRMVALRSRAEGVILVHQRAGSNSVLELDERGLVRRFIERPTQQQRALVATPWVHSGVAVLGPAWVMRIPEATPCDLPRDVYAPNIGQLTLVGCPLLGARVAVDSPDRLREADRLAGQATWGRRAWPRPGGSR